MEVGAHDGVHVEPVDEADAAQEAQEDGELQPELRRRARRRHVRAGLTEPHGGERRVDHLGVDLGPPPPRPEVVFLWHFCLFHCKIAF